MSGEASKRVMESSLTEIAFTDSIPFKDKDICPKAKILSMADMFAETLRCVQDHKSISEQFINF